MNNSHKMVIGIINKGGKANHRFVVLSHHGPVYVGRLLFINII